MIFYLIFIFLKHLSFSFLPEDTLLLPMMKTYLKGLVQWLANNRCSRSISCMTRELKVQSTLPVPHGEATAGGLERRQTGASELAAEVGKEGKQ